MALSNERADATIKVDKLLARMQARRDDTNLDAYCKKMNDSAGYNLINTDQLLEQLSALCTRIQAQREKLIVEFADLAQGEFRPKGIRFEKGSSIELSDTVIGNQRLTSEIVEGLDGELEVMLFTLKKTAENDLLGKPIKNRNTINPQGKTKILQFIWRIDSEVPMAKGRLKVPLPNTDTADWDQITKPGGFGFKDTRPLEIVAEAAICKQLSAAKSKYHNLSYLGSVHRNNYFGKNETSMYLYVDIANGGNLEGISSMDPQQLQKLAHDLAAGLVAAHGLNIVHRDIKPANILSNIDKQDNYFQIADWGEALNLNLEKDKEMLQDEPKGSRGFWAPELIAKQPSAEKDSPYAGQIYANKPEDYTNVAISNKIDIWAAGVTLCLLLIGKTELDDDQHTIELMNAAVKQNYLLQRLLDPNPDTRADANKFIEICQAGFELKKPVVVDANIVPEKKKIGFLPFFKKTKPLTVVEIDNILREIDEQKALRRAAEQQVVVSTGSEKGVIPGRRANFLGGRKKDDITAPFNKAIEKLHQQLRRSKIDLNTDLGKRVAAELREETPKSKRHSFFAPTR